MLEKSPLKQATVYVHHYAPELLFPVPRTMARSKTGIAEPLGFSGYDIWNAYEISWLDKKGKPVIALAEIVVPCNTPNIVESKSLKLYLNSFNQTVFDSMESVGKTLKNDLEKIIEAPISIKLFEQNQVKNSPLDLFTGTNLDLLDVECSVYSPEIKFLTTGHEKVEETLFTDLFKSNCLATGQPDWGSIWIRYIGPKINHEGLLKYFISYRTHSGFAEHCVEQIFKEISECCKPEKLTVYGRFVRRGGLDINPFRSNFETEVINSRHVRQ